MERQRFRRMGLSSILGLIASLKSQPVFSKDAVDFARSFYRGGFNNQSHGFTHKKKAAYKGHQPRRSKAQRRARAA